MQEPLHIVSWGTASVLARRGKKPETIAVAYRTPILIEAVSSAEAPIAARQPGADDLDPAVIRHLHGRLLSPVSLSGGPVDREMLPAIALLTTSLFHIPQPEAPVGKLDDLRWRQILEDGEAEAVRLAAAKAAEFPENERRPHGRLRRSNAPEGHAPAP